MLNHTSTLGVSIHQDEQRLLEFIAEITPELESFASRMCRKVWSISLDKDELVQEGIVAILAMRDRVNYAYEDRSIRGYCALRARGAIVDYIQKQFRERKISLEKYLEVETGKGTYRREIADTSLPFRHASPDERRRILEALRELTDIERIAVMAYFRIDNEQGCCFERGQFVRSTEYSARQRGLAKLASILQGVQA